MVIAADSTELAGAIEPSPSSASLRGLDEVNLLLAGALSGFGPYVAAFLAQQNWTQQNIGFVLTLGGFAGLLSQLPGGALLDAIRSKRVAVALGAGMVAAGALIIAIWPSFPLVLTALVLQGITGGFLGLAIAAISLGLVGNAALAERLGRNQRFASTGGVLAAGLMGFIAYFLSYRAIFVVAAALVLPLLFALGPHPAFRYPFRPSLVHSGSPWAERPAESPARKPLEDPRPARIRRLRVLIPDGQRVDAAARRRSVRVQQGGVFLPHRLRADHGAPDHRGNNGAVDRTTGEHMGPPAIADRRIRSIADPCAGVCLDRQSNAPHRRTSTRWS